MKNLIFFLLFFAVQSAFGQDVIISDSAFVSIKNDTFYQMRVQSYASGRKVTEENPLGRDTANVLSTLIGQAYDVSSQFANALLIVENQNRFQKTINGISASISKLSSLSYYQQIDARIGDQLIGAYNLRFGDESPVNCSIIRTNTGLIRLRQGTTNYILDVYTDLFIRVRNYNNETFFLVRSSANDARWTGANKKIILTKNGQR